MKVNVNEQPYDVVAPDTDMVVDLVRDQLGLTGTKQVCGSGVCGACTVLLDGEPVVSCLLPCGRVDGRRLVTVEGLADHPVARAFAAENALQCGFCTPGFVVEAAAFVDGWRSRSRSRSAAGPPTDAEIGAALAGHLCRCGAYPEIYAAVRAACLGTYDVPALPRGPRREAGDKVSGRAQYTVDVQAEGVLHGMILRATQAHAVVTSVDLAPALAIPGVRAAVELLAADRVVRYFGQEIAAVAAGDRATAERALAAVVVRYEPRPAVVSLDAARAPGAPEVYAVGRRRPPSAAEGTSMPAPWHGNVRGPIASFSVGRRRVRRRLSAARAAGDPLLVEGVFTTEAQVHTAFEPHAALARMLARGSRGVVSAAREVAQDEGDVLEVHVSTQAVAHLATQIAKRFGMPEQRVRVIAEHVGGGFGAKAGLTPEIVAAVTLARQAQAPVRVALDRLEELGYAGYRPPTRIELSLLADRRETLRALRLAAYADSGVAVGTTVASLARLIYPGDAKELLDYDVVTNLAPGAPFRGPGAPAMHFAVEQAVDEVARRLGRDPIELRQRWDTDPQRQRLYRWAAEQSAWRRRAALPRDGRIRRGIGVAAANWFYWWETGCVVELGVEDGRLVVCTAVQDIGTGSRTVLARAVAEAFGVPVDEVLVRLGDSRLPRGPMSTGSRATATILPAALDAAERLKAALVARAGRGAVATPAGIQRGSSVLAWRDTLSGADRLRVTSRRPQDDRRAGRSAPAAFAGTGLLGTGFAWMLRMFGGLRAGRGRPGAVYLAEVEVDTRLGHIRVTRVHAGIAAGRLVAPELATAQINGGVIQGIGYALYEQRDVDPQTGLVLTAGLEDYRIPGIADTPEIIIHTDPQGFDHVPGAGVGLAEVSTLPVAAAVANAVRDATGVRPYALPIRPDRLLADLGISPTTGGPA